MMDVVSLPMQALTPETEQFCAGQAEAIRVLAKRTAQDILEIGQRLIAVKERLPHGEWLPWLDREFGWSERTARTFMQVALTFKSETVADLTDCNIDARALYLIAAPDAAPELRDTVIEQAKTGKHITLEEAEKITAQRVAEVIRAERQGRDEAVRYAVKRAADQIKELREELDARKEVQQQPSLDDAINLLCQTIGKKKPSGRIIQALARELGEPISYGGKVYPPTDEATSTQAANELRIATEFTRILGYFSSELPTPAALLALLPDYLRLGVQRHLPAAQTWLQKFAELLDKTGG